MPMTLPSASIILSLFLAISCTKATPQQQDSTEQPDESNTTDSHTGEMLRDQDSDGYWSIEAGGLDCDDNDPSIHPGVEEIIDGVDQDCNGLVDDGTAAFDGDEDGWTIGAGDCNDNDPGTWPTAPDNPCDTIDQDCDGELETCTRAGAAYARIVSTDGNNEFGFAFGGGDFSGNGRPDVATGLTSITYVFDTPDVSGEVTDQDAFLRVRDSWSGGAGVGGVAFVNHHSENGPSAMLIGKTQAEDDGIVYLLCDPVSGDVVAEDVACAIYSDGDSDSSFGWTLDGGADVTGDGIADLLIGAPFDMDRVGVAYVVSGDARGDVDVTSSSSAQIWGDVERDMAGYSLVMAGDNNSDGVGDVLVGAAMAGSDGGRIGWFMGPISGNTTLSDADVLYTADTGSLSGLSLAGRADFDGDGREDFALTSWEEGIGGVHIYTDFGDGSLDGAVAHLMGVERADYVTSQGDYLGITLTLPDANGDGLSDVFAGAPYSMMGGWVNSNSVLLPSGAVALFLAPFSGTRTMLEADSLVFGENAEDGLGCTVSTVGDINGDGIDDLMAGAAFYDNPNDGNDVGRGAAFFFLGQESW